MVCMVFMTLFLVRKLGYCYIDDFLGFLYAWPMNNKDLMYDLSMDGSYSGCSHACSSSVA